MALPHRLMFLIEEKGGFSTHGGLTQFSRYVSQSLKLDSEMFPTFN
jgi:hypothetical protein